MEGKKNTDKWFPVVLLDDTDGKTPELTVVYSDIVCNYCYEADTSISAYSVTSADWKESGVGIYWLNIGESEFTNTGKYEVSVSAAVARTYRYWVEVVNKTSVEVSNDILDVSAGIIDQGNEYWAASASTSDVSAGCILAIDNKFDFSGTSVVAVTSGSSVDAASITNIVNAILSATIDTKTYEEVMEILLAMASGKIVRTANRFQYMKQDGSTALFTLESSSSERTRL